MNDNITVLSNKVWEIKNSNKRMKFVQYLKKMLAQLGLCSFKKRILQRKMR